jgi:GntR family transcriptional regulator/MocR family aminotransferase
VFFQAQDPPRNFFRLAYSSISAERIPEGIARLAGVIENLREAS